MEAEATFGVFYRINYSGKADFLVACTKGSYGFFRHKLRLFDLSVEGVFAQNRVILTQL